MGSFDWMVWAKSLQDSDLKIPVLVLGYGVTDGVEGLLSYWSPGFEGRMTQREREDLEKYLDRASHVILSVALRESSKRK